MPHLYSAKRSPRTVKEHQAEGGGEERADDRSAGAIPFYSPINIQSAKGLPWKIEYFPKSGLWPSLRGQRPELDP